MPKINVPTKNVSPQCAPDKLQVDDSEISGIANYTQMYEYVPLPNFHVRYTTAGQTLI